jgi:hypothetical protein
MRCRLQHIIDQYQDESTELKLNIERRTLVGLFSTGIEKTKNGAKIALRFKLKSLLIYEGLETENKDLFFQIKEKQAELRTADTKLRAAEQKVTELTERKEKFIGEIYKVLIAQFYPITPSRYFLGTTHVLPRDITKLIAEYFEPSEASEALLVAGTLTVEPEPLRYCLFGDYLEPLINIIQAYCDDCEDELVIMRNMLSELQIQSEEACKQRDITYSELCHLEQKQAKNFQEVENFIQDIERLDAIVNSFSEPDFEKDNFRRSLRC